MRSGAATCAHAVAADPSPVTGSANRLLFAPRVENRPHRALEIPDIARDERQVMGACRCGDKGVHDADRAAGGLAARHEPTPGLCDCRVDRQYPPLEARGQLVAEPTVEALAP